MNTISTKTYRDKWRSANLEKLLRRALVAEAICMVDHDTTKVIHSPYGSQPTATVQALAGTYSVSAYTTTDDDLTVDNEFIYAEQIFDFESLLSNFDLFADREDEIAYAIAAQIDIFVLNALTNDGTGAYSTPSGGFTIPSNIPVIMSNLLSKVAGYAQAYNGLYLVIEQTDIPGFIQSQAASGFTFADAVLNNGFMSSYMGVDVHVVLAGTFQNATIGTRTFTNLGRRVFGVKNVTTYAAPRGVIFDEKGVSGKTGKEIVVVGYIGFRAWFAQLALTVDITLTP